MIKKGFCTLFLSLTISLILVAQTPVIYTLGLENIRHHELRVSVVFEGLKQNVLEIRMPNSSPGRYATHNFAKNVYEERALDKKGKPITVRRISPTTWMVEAKDGYVRFEYTLYGNHADGTYTGIDARKLHLNMPASFIYGVGLKDRPIQLKIDLSDYPEWSVATQLVREDAATFSAPNYYYFYDSPVLVGKMDWRRWKVADQTIEIAMMHEGTGEELDLYTDWVKKIVTAEQEVYGELPEFDYGRYTFLMAYNPWVHGDGMEHRNSTICTRSQSLEQSAGRLIGTVAHEFFHAWNVERIRPASLEPFDFDEANLSGALWFAEGFTSYYDDLILCRTGIRSPEEYISGINGTMNYVINSPGRNIRNPIQMSHNAPFVDAATSVDQTNYSNTFISYYSYGSVLGLGLDLMLRSTFEQISLDDYMRLVWRAYGKSEKPYKISDLRNALEDLTKDKKFANHFFDRYIYESNLPDFKALFNTFGVGMELINPGKAYFGNIQLDENLKILSPVLKGTALYEAGMETGDVLIAIDGQQITPDASFVEVANTLVPGKSYEITYKQLGLKKTGTFTAMQDPAFTVFYLPDSELSAEQIARRRDWLKIP